MRISIVDPHRTQELRTLISSVPGYEVAWVATQAREAFRLCVEDTPELLLMALQLSDMDGVEATRHIMKYSPCPILLVTNSLDSHAGKIFAAMGEGAKDVIHYPAQHSALAEFEQARKALLRKLRTLATLQRPDPISERSGSRLLKEFNAKVSATKPRVKIAELPPLVVIGASTGGPNALATLLRQLPSNLNAALIIVQHLTEEFSFDLTAWLDTQSPLNVHLAIEDSRPRSSNVYIAHSDDHLVVSENCTFAYTPEPRTAHYRPSVDIFFQSLATHWRTPGVAVLLTGMGRDGAAGLAELRHKGWHTIAQDQQSSVVYGMPKAAKELGAAVEILPLNAIGSAIVRHCPSTPPTLSY